MVSIMASDMANGLPGSTFSRPGRKVHMRSLVFPGSATPFHSSAFDPWLETRLPCFMSGDLDYTFLILFGKPYCRRVI
jgi:hypothetical protein